MESSSGLGYFEHWEYMTKGEQYTAIISYYREIGRAVDLTSLEFIRRMISEGSIPDKQGKFRPSN